MRLKDLFCDDTLGRGLLTLSAISNSNPALQ